MSPDKKGRHDLRYNPHNGYVDHFIPTLTFAVAGTDAASNTVL